MNFLMDLRQRQRQNPLCQKLIDCMDQLADPASPKNISRTSFPHAISLVALTATMTFSQQSSSCVVMKKDHTISKSLNPRMHSNQYKLSKVSYLREVEETEMPMGGGEGIS
ncbi:hypothetical protein VNO77_18464 [Canavalia gladiata]|uniref:Uncharacterized protein n=1 Tax=Canavalia gladiata TaxID=3824 RepID=A0AAN9LKZ1_CANGL